MSLKNLDRSKYRVKEVLQSYLFLEKRGRNYWALCPFHDDNKASLSISEEKNIFKCFSCGVSGDALAFIMRKEQFTLPQAVFKAHEILKLPTQELQLQRENPEEEAKKRLLKFNEFVLDFYERSLFSPLGAKALDYLTKQRNLTVEVIKKYRLGFAPPGGEILKTLYSIQKISVDFQFINNEFLLETGLFTSSVVEGVTAVTPAFRNRIVFPIFSLEGKIIGFSARALEDNQEEVKYLHSRETLLFKKSNLLYNLPELSQKPKEVFIYLFEGFFDVISASLIEPNCIALAILGSEISNEVLSFLGETENKKIVVVLDHDEAGKAASLKLFKKALRFGLEIYSLPLDFSLGKDLSEIYKNNRGFKLPKPIVFTDWIKTNWSELFHSDKSNTKNLFKVNQLINSLLQSIFFGIDQSNRVRLNEDVNPQAALAAVENIFQLYSIVDLSELEKQAIQEFKARYIEAINLNILEMNKTENQVFSEKIELKPITLVSSFSEILEIWEKAIQFHAASVFLHAQLQQWESPLLENYSNELQLILLPEEQEFLKQIIQKIEKFSGELTPIKSDKYSGSSTKEIFNFLELYYSLIHQLLNKTEDTVKKGPNINIEQKLSVLDQISKDREGLSSQSIKIFNNLLSWEKSFQEI